MSKATLDGALAVIEATRNFMVSLTTDPTIPAYAAEAISKHIDALDRYVEAALGEDDD